MRRKKSLSLIIVMMILAMGIGYAYLSTTLSINGTTDVDSNSWDVHWDNIQVIDGSVTGDQVITAPTIDSSETTVTYHVRLKEPGDFYEFAIDAVNDGTIDAMVDTITSKLNNVVITTLPAYLDYSVTYLSGQTIEQNHLLAANSADTYKVRVAYRNDIDPSELPSTAQSLSLSVSITYVQADSNATVAHSFGTDSWDTVISNVKTGIIPKYYQVGMTKEIEMGDRGTHTVRISNISTPNECNNQNFSQTACGFVIEFANIMWTSRLTMPEVYTNVGGFPMTSTYSGFSGYLLNLFPEPVRSNMLTTRVISGHGPDDPNNFITYDKIYYLSMVEIYGTDTHGGELYDNVSTSETRQLDYYSITNTSLTNKAPAKKTLDSVSKSWWLRSADTTSNQSFLDVYKDGSITSNFSDNYQIGSSPAFRLG
ncbi:MAG: hypothetical protein IKQ06_05715 [Bacilli bacterium]|nr:hypothetical protein [Bacilli bacterium]